MLARVVLGRAVFALTLSLSACGLLVDPGEHHLDPTYGKSSSGGSGAAGQALAAGAGASAGEAGAPEVTTTGGSGDIGGQSSGGAGGEETAGAAGAATVCAGPCGTVACGDCPSAEVVTIHSDYYDADSLIDATEVTNNAYAAFLAVNYDPALQASECAWNDSFVPADGWPAPDEDAAVPVVYVDWCDAAAYCAWANRRLCGLFGGASAALVDGAAESMLYDEWYNACTGGEAGSDTRGYQRYPYGDTYDASSCNGADFENGNLPHAVGFTGACEGAYAGLVDMSGNVSEWTNACDTGDGAAALCRTRGGSCNSGTAFLRCDGDNTHDRAFSSWHLGFRCCADPT